jgi:hypothetical protein
MVGEDRAPAQAAEMEKELLHTVMQWSIVMPGMMVIEPMKMEVR